jgi:hypothetical protein
LKFVCQDIENKIASLDALIAENSVAADIECGISSLSTAGLISDASSSKDNNMIQYDMNLSTLDGSNSKKRRVSLEESSIVYSEDLIIID